MENVNRIVKKLESGALNNTQHFFSGTFILIFMQSYHYHSCLSFWLKLKFTIGYIERSC